jgi:uncharacterized protein (TIGR02996 family)
VSATAEAWLDDIIAHPKDDAPRLMFADWLLERGEQARAEFIRVQCELADWRKVLKRFTGDHGDRRLAYLRRRERALLDEHGFDWFGQLVRIARLDRGHGPDRNAWHFRSLAGTLGWCLFRRGFVAEITCRLADWCGGRCPAEGCVHGTVTSERGEGFRCPACLGTGRTPGHGPDLVRAAPLEYVRLSDREPFAYTAGGRPTYLWRCVENGFGGERNLLPVALFDFLPGHEHGHVAEYATRQEAESALSDACLAWANAEADRAAR